MKTYQLRIFPTNEQVNQLLELSTIDNDIWNTLIDIQQKYYEEHKKIHSKFDLINLLPNLKNTTHQHWQKFNSKACQTIATRVFQSYRSFFTLIKKDKTAKPPQKKTHKGFHTLVFNQSGWIFKNNTLYINKIPFKYRTHLTNINELNIKEIHLKLRNDKWLVDLVVNESINYPDSKLIQTKVLAIDLGLKRLGTGVDNKGNQVIISNAAKSINKYFNKRIDTVKSKLSKTTKNSNRYNHLNKTKKKLYSKKNSQIKQSLHIQSKALSNMNYNTIIVGDLTVKQLMQEQKNKYSKVSKSFGNSNINMFLQFLSYKCQAKGINLVKLDEKYTTQTNCLTGKKFKEKVALSQRTVKLNNDLIIDRDLNSAVNILKRFYNNHLASVNEPLEINSDVLSSILEKGSYVL